VIEKGPDWFAGIGTRDSTGTKLLSISGDCERPGVYEVEFGVTVSKLLEMVDASDAQAVQIGGPSGACVAPKDFGRRICFEDVPTGGSVIVFGRNRDRAGGALPAGSAPRCSRRCSTACARAG
jgi:[NiFe] hydrogenase diaphorase moiety large subunit